MACEDFPCCGHEAGDCPTRDREGREVWTCVECRKPLRRGATSSICARCRKRLERRWADGGDFDYSMNY
jgi:Zn-finger protein